MEGRPSSITWSSSSEDAEQRGLVKTEDLRYLESNLRYLTGIAKKAGYKQAESLNIKHVRNLEDLLEVERRERKRLEEERTRMGRGDEEIGERGDGMGTDEI